jgi:ubiquinone/menaquinone biosynthesis C-methylase UbiE
MIDVKELLSAVGRQDSAGVYCVEFSNAEQSVELEMRERVASEAPADPLREISRHHSIPVMDCEVARFLATVPRGGAIVDVGGCWGWHWRNIRAVRPDVRVVIVDFVRANLSRALALLGDLVNTQVFLAHGDATDLRFPDGSFDGYWSVQTLQHIPSFDRAVAEAWRVLKPGGAFANYSLNVQPLIRRLYELRSRPYTVEGWVEGAFWLARASDVQRQVIESAFGVPVAERWSEILFKPELHLPVAGRASSILGRVDAALSNGRGRFRGFARQHSFHCVKPQSGDVPKGGVTAIQGAV